LSSSSMCGLFHPSITPSVLGRNILTRLVCVLRSIREINFYTYAKQEESWDSTVGIATGYGLED
jgi:hypothetical protein